jgi:hypothetical protein
VDISKFDIDRFWSNVNIRGDDDCWKWQGGSLSPNGSGIFYYNKKTMLAHRMAYILKYGDIENIKNKDTIFHICPNNNCCNPKHLLIRKDWNKILLDDVLINKFWSNVDKKSKEECWMWRGNQSTRYGNIGYKYKNYRPHRFSYMIHNGLDSIPEGMCVCHKCDQPFCVNPDHLFLGTQLENIEDKVKKNRCQHMKCETNGNAKLKNEDVYNIREMYADHLHTQKELGEIFDMSEEMIGLIVRGKYWQEVGGRITNRYKLKDNK